MTLSKDEEVDALKEIIKATIDLNQAANYMLNSEYSKCYNNLTAVISSVNDIIEKIES